MPEFCSEPGCFDVAEARIGTVPFCGKCYAINMEAPTEPEEWEDDVAAQER